MKKIQNFKYPVISETDRTYGVSLGPVLREDGDWRDFLPPEEDQRINGVESSACYIEGQQHLIATLQEEQYSVLDQNYSARFNALLSDGGENGGDPIKGALSIKKDGLIPDEKMSFEGITSWAEYHSWKGVNKNDLVALGKQWLREWEPKYLIVAEREEPVETKYASLREALKRGPVAVSVCAWYGRNGMYYKPMGKRDNHLILAVFLDDQNRIHVRDTYAPYYKILEPNTNFEFALTWTLAKQATKEEVNIVIEILKKLAIWAGLIAKEQAVTAPITRQEPRTEELPPKPIKEPHGSLLITWAKAIETYEGANPSWCNPGAIRSPQGGFLKFKTYQEGFDYLCDYLTRAATGKHKAYSPDFTLLQFFQVYSPVNDGNDPVRYSQFVAKRLGVEITYQIKNLV